MISKTVSTPKLCLPYKSIKKSLRDFLQFPGKEDDCVSWKQIRRSPDVLSDFQSGKVWKELRRDDGHLFFNTDINTHDLEIGLTLAYDWYGLLLDNALVGN